CLQRLRGGLRRLLNGKAATENAASSGFSTFSVPVVALSDNVIVWYNDAYLTQVAQGAENVLLPIAKVAPGVDLAKAAAPEGQDVTVDGKRYTVYGNQMNADGNLFFVLFVENTALKTRADEYLASRPSVLYFAIDTYEEVLKEMKESERAIIMSNIDIALEKYIGKSSGFLRRISSSRYLAVVEERHMKDMVSNRFDILDEVRRADEDNPTVTLSIGVGRMGTTMKECEESARQALDMALGRGGDQAAVKGLDGFEFYGGVTRSVEKRTKVKSRIVATAIKDLMAQYERVLIMGHKDSDMDSVGAAVGMLRFCRICKKPAAIVIDAEKSMANTLIDLLSENGYEDDMISPADAMPLTGSKTLVVVVDTHIQYLLESDDVYRSCGGVVVIDHHRRMVGHIEDALIFYHEPYASSASELVSELLQYVGDGKNDKLTPVEAEALLAGIMLDTRTFALHVGVRTFEAAAYLRRMGAQTATVKKLFSSTMNDYLYRSHLVSEAKIYHGCAVSMSDKVPFECEVVAPQAANELLTIDGVDASFVGIKQGDVVRISARSMGEVNVQLVMEKIGGGGHLTMAGAQLSGVGLEEARKKLADAIDAYMAERTHVKV
ncbi:DHH family phosphoesterase, partial [Clostridia bacterium OttesenSCG-928-O13]|nr:DHH family phosphoesterase [Clostridia bacterium OttesenSCG-928-O13]